MANERNEKVTNQKARQKQPNGKKLSLTLSRRQDVSNVIFFSSTESDKMLETSSPKSFGKKIHQKNKTKAYVTTPLAERHVNRWHHRPRMWKLGNSA